MVPKTLELQDMPETAETVRKGQRKRGLQTFEHRRQGGDREETAGDKTVFIEVIHIEPLSPLSPPLFNSGDSYSPRISWLSPLSPLSPPKTTGTPLQFGHLKTTKAPVLLGFVRFSHAQNVQKEVIYD